MSEIKNRKKIKGKSPSDVPAQTSPKKNELAREPKEEAPKLLVDNPSRWKNFATRTLYGAVMVFSFAFVNWLGHIALSCLVFILQFMMFKEVTSLGYSYNKEKKLPFFRLLSWYFFMTTIFFTYGKALKSQISSLWFLQEYFPTFMKHHSWNSFVLYISGFVFFVCSLKSGMYLYQFKQYAWIHMALLIIVVQSSFLISNIFDGIIWFLLPCSLIIINDCFAYFFGFFFGRHPLIKLSPKKTWEGFIGATFSTMLAAFFLSRFLSQWDHMICPKLDFETVEACIRPKVFIPVAYALPKLIQSALASIGLNWTYVMIAPVQLHALSMGAFSSLIAPFGGFFASGLKRALRIKDFADTIPGHGGFTDRFDCQLIMGLFSAVYYSNFIRVNVSVDSVMRRVLELTVQDQVEILRRLQDYLATRGLA